jgi:hypothetical protein
MNVPEMVVNKDLNHSNKLQQNSGIILTAVATVYTGNRTELNIIISLVVLC